VKLRIDVRRRFVRVHLEGQTESIQGVLTGRTRDFYTLRAASVVGEQGTYTLEGTETLIPRARVLFIQTIERTTP
jgi:hypothetical protein